MPLRIINCGSGDYRAVLKYQHFLRDQLRSGKGEETILIVEHNPVITLGARQSANKLLLNEKQLGDNGIVVVPIRRGGGSTAHNPGQIVFYPILDLDRRGLGINEFIRTLEQAGIDLLAAIGIDATRKKGFPGLWAGQKKIASVGVRVSKFITWHGIAINIDNDLSIFNYMIPCGLDGVEMTSASELLGQKIGTGELKLKLRDILLKHFG